MPASDVEPALFQFLVQFAELTISAGVSAPILAQIANRAFVEAASAAAKLRNKKINQSAVAAMTGLNRAEVKNTLGEKRHVDLAAGKRRQGVDRVIEAWQQDPDFTDARGKPRPLSLSRGTGAFADLVRRYSGDIPASSVLRELLRRQLVETTEHVVRFTPVVAKTAGELNLHSLSLAMASLLAIVNENPRSPHRIERMGGRIRLRHPFAAKLLRRHLDSAIPLFLESAQIAADGLGNPKTNVPEMPPLHLEVIALIPH